MSTVCNDIMTVNRGPTLGRYRGFNITAIESCDGFIVQIVGGLLRMPYGAWVNIEDGELVVRLPVAERKCRR